MASYSFIDVGSSEEDLDSLPSVSTDMDSEADLDDDAQAEWDRSMEQLQDLLTMILVPWVGKVLGRKFAFWGWSKYMDWVYLDIQAPKHTLTKGR